MKIVEENEELKKAIAKELKIEDPSEETAKGILNDARTTRSMHESDLKDNDIVRLSGD